MIQLADYKEYVVSNNFVEASKSGFYVNWVKKFLKLNIADSLSENDKII